MAGVSLIAFLIAETRCAPEQYAPGNQAQLISSAAGWWWRRRGHARRGPGHSCCVSRGPLSL